MTGPELAARLKSRHPGLKVLFMSGYSDHASAGKGLPGSEAEHLQKPFPPAVLTRKVREILGPARNP
jgi:DNA-binding NtrC family response regulator